MFFFFCGGILVLLLALVCFHFEGSLAFSYVFFLGVGNCGVSPRGGVKWSMGENSEIDFSGVVCLAILPPPILLTYIYIYIFVWRGVQPTGKLHFPIPWVIRDSIP